jgi:hypothetical protein
MENAKYFKLKEYKEYLEFIHSCKTKTYDDKLVLHKHHIIPKHLWHNEKISVDVISNIIKISVDDHIKAHLMLAECYNEDTYECISNLRSARILSNKSITDKTTLDKIAETYYGSNNPFYGKTHTDQIKQKLANHTKSNRTGKSYDEFYGNERAEIERKKRAKKTRTDVEYKEAAKKISEKLKGRYVGEKNPTAQSFMIDGLVFGCRNDMLNHFGISMYLLKKRKKIIKITKEEYNKLKNK